MLDGGWNGMMWVTKNLNYIGVEVEHQIERVRERNRKRAQEMRMWVRKNVGGTGVRYDVYVLCMCPMVVRAPTVLPTRDSSLVSSQALGARNA